MWPMAWHPPHHYTHTHETISHIYENSHAACCEYKFSACSSFIKLLHKKPTHSESRNPNTKTSIYHHNKPQLHLNNIYLWSPHHIAALLVHHLPTSYQCIISSITKEIRILYIVWTTPKKLRPTYLNRV